MFKAMILLKRREGVSLQEFSEWWLGAHAPLAMALPKVRGAMFNLVDGDGSGPYDGVSELWFDSQADFEAAYATDQGKAVAADSMANVSKRERMFVAEHVLVDRK
ncbi:MAG: EthD family reductase [Comamonadaceae bacterium]|nr:MAG: EthD family reductase [Comamonadaceae bacterium]